MSRYELKELERIISMTEEDIIVESERQAQVIYDKYGYDLTAEEGYKLTDEYKGFQ